MGPRPRNLTQRGQALIMVTLALFAMFGLIGLAVDFGWAFYVEKSAQAAADAAALAAVRMAQDNATILSDYDCTGTVVQCYATPTACPNPGSLPRNLNSACLYAAQNGFSTANPRQNVTVQASDRTTAPTVTGCTPSVHYPPTAPCVETYYWVTVRVSQSVPQLFSAIFNNTDGLVSARATAGVGQSQIIGSLILLNRENEGWIGATGRNFEGQGSPIVNVPGGILLASNSASAGDLQGSAQVQAPFTYIRTGGDVTVAGSASWTAPPTTQPDGSGFLDPFRNKTQPPLLTNPGSLPSIPVVEANGGKAILDTSVAACSSGVCPPGNYYAVDKTTGAPTGKRIEISSNISFSGAVSGMATMGLYVFWGGLNIGQADVSFGPGEYVFAGVTDPTIPVFDNDNKAFLTTSSTGPGTMFIFTDDSYEGRLDSTALSLQIPDLQFGMAAIKSGNNAGSGVQLNGLDRTDAEVISAGLQDYPVVIWQDRMNSNVKYLYDGTLDLTCAASSTATGGAPSINNPCMRTNSNVRQLEIWATPNTQYDGVIYQPRGSWTLLQAAGDYTGALQIISGAMKTQGSGLLTLTSPSQPITQIVVALVE